ncbi:MAG: pyridoxal-phosphate dependent enzyme, partial [Chitinophagaceae bacterium]
QIPNLPAPYQDPALSFLMMEVRLKRAATATLINVNAQGDLFRNVLQVFPLCTDGKITHLVCTAGTGGTITGTAKYLKEKNPNIKVWAVDVFGSLLTHYFKTGEIDMSYVHPYISEGFGEDFVPQNYDMSVIDEFVQVTDKDGAV